MSEGRAITRRRTSFVALLAAGFIVLVSSAVPSHAQHTSRLARTLNSDADFRVRVQAAFALGNSGDTSVIPSLERALQDGNPAVRAAAATALGRIGHPSAVPALRRASRDSSSAVRLQAQRAIEQIAESQSASNTSPERSTRPRDRGRFMPAITIIPTEDEIRWARVQYVVKLGDMRNRSGFAGDELARHMRSEIQHHLRVLRGVAVLHTEDAQAQREIARRRIPKLRMDGNVNTVDRRRRGREISIRCEVSLMLLDDAQESIRGELRGAATGTEERSRRARNQEERLAERALSGAVRAALSDASSAIQRAARR